ncbi:5-formyltetrahydrofolate cyclo-ligase [uncultured Cyclobacterium sp.]|uniref:5-formyltetrahydrofolate cyclo-ligase n=1 Tax=uncultured Cyclobacterium sp. TaxID=453820 RepID=UPI0030EDC3F9|tara:strand:- start:107991 stop:108575 length:585 start_codon:yes stop_codon:yes gene_type:complete
MVAKEILRNQLKNERKALGAEERAQYSEMIMVHCLEYLKQLPHVKHVHLFLPIKRLKEINTVPLLRALFRLDYQVYSSITVHSSRKMATVRLTADTVYVKDKMGIPVPVPADLVTETDLIDLVFVPLLGIDTAGNRLGYGLGFYDEYFKEIGDRVLKIGLSFKAPLETEIPHESHDVPLDGCIYPEGMVVLNKK